MVGKPGKRDHRAVLLEAIDTRVRQVAEGHDTLVRGQQHIRVEIVELHARVEQLEKAVIDGFKEVKALIAEHTHA